MENEYLISILDEVKQINNHISNKNRIDSDFLGADREIPQRKNTLNVNDLNKLKRVLKIYEDKPWYILSKYRNIRIIKNIINNN